LPIRRLLALAAALVIAGLVTVAPAGAATNKCARYDAKYKVLAQSTTGVVFGASKGARGVGCLFSEGKLRKLPDTDPRFSNNGYGYQLAGRYVAYAVVGTVATVSVLLGGVRVVNLKTGKSIVSEDAYPISRSPTEDFSYEVDTVVLRSNGSVAWYTDASGTNHESLVARKDVGKAVTVLDRGLDLAKGSLALSRKGTTVYWTRGGVAKAASLG
jgi:hypothetical protein